MWADVFLVKDGASPDPANPNFDWQSVHRVRKRKQNKARHYTRFPDDPSIVLTRYLPRHKVRKEKNLLGSHDEDQTEEDEEDVSAR